MFRLRKDIRDKESSYITIKGSIFQEDRRINSVYGLNKRLLNYVGQNLIELQGEIVKSTIIVGDFNPLSEMDRSSGQETSKNIVELNNFTNQLDTMDMYRLFHPTTAEYTLFSNSHRNFTKIGHILNHRTHLNTFKRRIIIQYLLLDYRN